MIWISLTLYVLGMLTMLAITLECAKELTPPERPWFIGLFTVFWPLAIILTIIWLFLEFSGILSD